MKIRITEKQHKKLVKENQDFTNLMALILSGQKENILIAFEVAKSQGYEEEFDNYLFKEFFELLDILYWNDRNIKKSVVEIMGSTTLDLSGKGIDYIPTIIKHLPYLKSIDLSNNNFVEFPDVTNVTSLESLDVNENQIEKIPNTIGNLINLRYLALDDNNIQELPESIGRLVELEGLHLENNNLSFLPKSIINLKKMQHLTITGNNFSEESDRHIEKILPHTIVWADNV